MLGANVPPFTMTIVKTEHYIQWTRGPGIWGLGDPGPRDPNWHALCVYV